MVGMGAVLSLYIAASDTSKTVVARMDMNYTGTTHTAHMILTTILKREDRKEEGFWLG